MLILTIRVMDEKAEDEFQPLQNEISWDRSAENVAIEFRGIQVEITPPRYAKRLNVTVNFDHD